MTQYTAMTVAGKIRFDLYGEMQAADRIAVFLTPDEALSMGRELTRRALGLGATQELDAQELV